MAEHTSKNYSTDGGDTWVIDGKLVKDGEEVDVGVGDVDLSGYLKKADADNDYAASSELSELKDRVKALEDASEE